MEDLIVRLRIEEDNQKFEKRSNKNFYEAKANMIEDSKGKASTSKGLKQKKTAQGYKGNDQEGKNKRFKGTCYIYNSEGHSQSSQTKQEGLAIGKHDRGLPSLLVMVSKVNLTTNNKDW